MKPNASLYGWWRKFKKKNNLAIDFKLNPLTLVYEEERHWRSSETLTSQVGGHVSAFSYMERQTNYSGLWSILYMTRQAKSRKTHCSRYPRQANCNVNRTKTYNWISSKLTPPTMISLLKGTQCTHDPQEQSSEAAAQSAIAGVCDGTHGKAQAMHQEAMAKLDHGWLRKGWLAQSFANQREES